MSEFLQFRHRALRTPIHRYAHPGTGREVTVIGMMHVGERGYFTGLRDIIDRCAAGGAVIQCEGADPSPEEEVSPDVAAVLVADGRMDRLEKQRIVALGWTTQHDVFGRPPSWQRIDLPTAEIIRRIGPGPMLTQVLTRVHRLERPCTSVRSIERYRLTRYLVFAAFLLVVARAEGLVRRNRPSRGVDQVLIDQRNAVALDGLWNTDQDTVLIWGCAHLPALTAAILSRGFRPVAVPEWHTAATLPPLTSTLRRILTGRAPHPTRDTTPQATADAHQPGPAPLPHRP